MSQMPPPSVAAKALRAYQTENPERALIEKHVPLVKHTVNRMRIYLPAVLDQDDLYSVGLTGLIGAARKYNPAQAQTFPAFAAMHIRGAVQDELRRMDWMSRSARDKAKQVQEKISTLEQNLGRPATEAECANTLGISEVQYSDLIEEIKPATFLPLDGEAFSEDSDQVALHEIIADDNQVPASEALDKKEMLSAMVSQLQKLPDLQKKVLALYYFEEMRLSEIAAVFGLTEGRISQIHTQAVLSLRTFLQRSLNTQATSPCS